jgi:hypothetical protein
MEDGVSWHIRHDYAEVGGIAGFSNTISQRIVALMQTWILRVTSA